MNARLLMSLAAIVTFGIGMLVLTCDPDLSRLPIPESLRFTQEPVLVILVGSPENVRRIREVIPAERVLAEAPGAFATAEDRIIAASAEAAGAPINALDWIDRELEIVAVPMDGGRRWEQNRGKRGGQSKMSAEDQARTDKLAKLATRPSLTIAEATALLMHMDATGQF